MLPFFCLGHDSSVNSLCASVLSNLDFFKCHILLLAHWWIMIRGLHTYFHTYVNFFVHQWINLIKSLKYETTNGTKLGFFKSNYHKTTLLLTSNFNDSWFCLNPNLCPTDQRSNPTWTQQRIKYFVCTRPEPDSVNVSIGWQFTFVWIAYRY